MKTSDGVALLEGSNTFTGTTRIEGGAVALTNGGHLNSHAMIDNDATFVIADGTHTLGDIIGSGSTLVGGSVQLNATSIVQGTLSLGGDYSALIASSTAANMQNAAVPEPSVFVLLLSLGIMLAVTAFRRR